MKIKYFALALLTLLLNIACVTNNNKLAPESNSSQDSVMSENTYLGLRTVVYNVNDLEAAKKWYSELLGFDPYFDQPFYVGFNVAGYELGLSPNEVASVPGGSYAYWGVKDARAELARVLGMGATLHEEIQDVGDGILVVAVADPWGNIFGIIENPHFKLKEPVFK